MPAPPVLSLRRLLPWFAWLLLFYSTWSWLLVQAGGLGVLVEHWGIAVAMGLGSYVAGSTPMGGGTVGFPILVLLFDQPAELGRDFSFAVQSIGMVSASIFILCRRQPLEWAMLGPALLGSLIGTPLGILFVAPLVPALWIKLLFAVVWASFGVLHLMRTREFCSVDGPSAPMPRFDAAVGFSVGLGAGLCVASVTGVGIDMILYAALILLRRADLKMAIPTSVLIMAFTSLIGIAFKSMVTGVQPGVYENWLAAAPIVALGAPLGVFIVNRIGRQPTLYFVAVLCVAQFVWTVWREWAVLGLAGLGVAVGGVLLFNLVFEAMHRWGQSHQGNERPPQDESALNTYSTADRQALRAAGSSAG